MNVDAILRQIGEFGAYQKVTYVLLNLLGITHGARMMMAVFILFRPDHRCAIPSYPNDTYEVQSDYHADVIRQFIPNNSDSDSQWDACNIYSHGSDNDPTSQTGCERWVYDKSLFKNTAAMEFNMVCDDSLLGSHSQTSQMAGYIVGVLVFGAIGDRWGRKLAMYLSAVIYLVAGFGLSWSPSVNYTFFVLNRFVTGACSAGAFTAAAVLSLELVGPSKRLWTGVLIHMTFAIGGLYDLLIAYFIRDWFLFNILATCPTVIALSYWWIIPESPRWLAKKGRMEEAETILRKIAKFNGKTFPESLSANKTPDNGVADLKTSQSGLVNGVKPSQPEGINGVKSGQSEGANGVKTVGYETGSGGSTDKVSWQQTETTSVLRNFLRMFSYRVLVIRNFILFFNWFTVAMAYYGLSFTADQLSAGGLFTNFLLSMSMDFPANALALVLLDRWGRRKLHASSMVVGGVGCLVGVLTTMVAPSDFQWVTVVVAMLGKLGSAIGFILVYIYSSELFPTTVRSASMGFSSAFARTGSILASYVQQWSLDLGGDLGHALPLLVFGAFCLAAGVLTTLLPETLHKDLPDTVEDALVFGRDPDKDEKRDGVVRVVEVFTMEGGEVQMEMEAFHPDPDTDPHHHHHHPPPPPLLDNDDDETKKSSDDAEDHSDAHRLHSGKRVNFLDPSEVEIIND